jgi:hypothetical protein
MFSADPFSPGQATVEQTRRSPVKIHDGVEPPGKQAKDRGILIFETQSFVNIRTSVKTIRESRFHEHTDTESREFFPQGMQGRRQEKTISHRTKTHE